MPETNHSTDLDKELQRLATGDWEAFVQLIGNDAIIAAKVCMLKSRGKSLKTIATKFNKSKDAVYRMTHSNCKPCVLEKATQIL